MGKLVHGVGTYAKGEYVAYKSTGVTQEYDRWKGMLRRCYDEKFKARRKWYENCAVSGNFKNFQYFAKWCNKQIGFENKGYALDKDFLGDGLTYSEEVCVFIPNYLNSFLTDSYSSRGETPIGVHYNKYHEKYMAYVNINNKLKHLGYFTHLNDAMTAYKEAKEARAKQLAIDTLGIVDIRVTNALNNFVVDFNDERKVL